MSSYLAIYRSLGKVIFVQPFGLFAVGLRRGADCLLLHQQQPYYFHVGAVLFAVVVVCFVLSLLTCGWLRSLLPQLRLQLRCSYHFLVSYYITIDLFF